MFTMAAVAYAIVIVVGISCIQCMEVIPERANVAYVNEKYLSDVDINVRRYTRRGNYYINLSGTNKHTWSNNVTVHFLFHEFLHNEYKRSFVELHNKYCDVVNKNPYIGTAVRSVGLTCPTPPRAWILANITVPTENFPNVWPFEKCRVDVTIETTAEKDRIIELQLYVIFKQKLG